MPQWKAGFPLQEYKERETWNKGKTAKYIQTSEDKSHHEKGGKTDEALAEQTVVQYGLL